MGNSTLQFSHSAQFSFNNCRKLTIQGVIFEVLIVVKMSMLFFWAVTPCGLVGPEHQRNHSRVKYEDGVVSHSIMFHENLTISSELL
jgi:hypothetical protein